MTPRALFFVHFLAAAEGQQAARSFSTVKAPLFVFCVCLRKICEWRKLK